MNKHDRSNFEFIMSLTEEEFEQWFEKLSDDEVDYANKLFAMAKLEVADKLAESLVRDACEYNAAKAVLGKFTLKGYVS